MTHNITFINPQITDAITSINPQVTDAITSINPQVTDAITSVNPQVTDAITSVNPQVTDAITSVNPQVTDAITTTNRTTKIWSKFMMPTQTSKNILLFLYQYIVQHIGFNSFSSNDIINNHLVSKNENNFCILYVFNINNSPMSLTINMGLSSHDASKLILLDSLILMSQNIHNIININEKYSINKNI